ncbi:MAG: hypothetical protein LC802_15715 [Acidobacteria bacterium]|nr:hypothetical protein [Acidobacteriota bacterium]
MLKQLLSISFILVLTANGWGTALAANQCPHEDCVSSGTAPPPQSRHGAREVDAEMEEHCSGDMEQVERSEHESHGTASEEQSVPPPTAKSFGMSGGKTLFCAHCMGAPQSPVKDTSKVTQNQARRGGDVGTPPVLMAVAPPGVASFPALAPSQCSPPTSKRRHLLLSIFLI